MTIRRVLAAAAAAVLLLAGAYAGFLGHRARHTVSLAPDGTFRVGRAVHELADRSRTDELAPVGGNPRVLSIMLWYPAAATGGTPSAYAPGAWSGLHRFGWAQTGFDRIDTGTYDEAPLAAGTFPIVVLMPGLGFSAPQYAALAARIAGRGYLVAGVTPPTARTSPCSAASRSGRPRRAIRAICPGRGATGSLRSGRPTPDSRPGGSRCCSARTPTPPGSSTWAIRSAGRPPSRRAAPTTTAAAPPTWTAPRTGRWSPTAWTSRGCCSAPVWTVPRATPRPGRSSAAATIPGPSRCPPPGTSTSATTGRIGWPRRCGCCFRSAIRAPCRSPSTTWPASSPRSPPAPPGGHPPSRGARS
ncbi:alpha/beta hydrolase [Paractinoplanes durhamensis]|uniref:hypothetical protein n=1 Tax=Paractinoplanes durhamensis TaxID=113563 RepID=UPI0036399EC7